MIELSLELETAFMSKPQTAPSPAPPESSSIEGTSKEERAMGPNPQITALAVQAQNFLKVWGLECKCAAFSSLIANPV